MYYPITISVAYPTHNHVAIRSIILAKKDNVSTPIKFRKQI